ncbi:MAG: VCBS repeat-containing protein [Deltaproteobacteria bacterium]|nr:VCBS repeat-containing protein [Deltaproteobacteria bacterium]
MKMEVELSTGAAALSPELLLTVVDAVQPSDVPFAGRRVRCGEMSALAARPTYSLDSFGPGSGYAGLFSAFRTPFTRDATIAFPSSVSSVDVNPWRAMLLQVEAQALAFVIWGPQPLIFVEGCACVRLDPNGTHPDAALDAEIKATCPLLPSGGALRVQLSAPPPPPGVRLVLCGPEELLRIAGQPMPLLPGLCLEVTRCSGSGQEECFACASLTCDEINAYQLPVIVRAGPQAEEAPPTLVSVRAQTPIVPMLNLEGDASCGDVRLEARAVAGGPSYRLPIRCVQPAAFAFPPGLSIASDRLVDLAMIPEERSAGAVSRPARVAALFDGPQGPRLLEVGVRDGQLVPMGELRGFAPGELPSALHGYLRSTPEGPRAVLAVGTLGDSGVGVWQPQVRIVEPSSAGSSPRVLATRGDDCRPKDCGAACRQLTDCRLTVGEVPRLLLRSGDLDEDGATDLAVASDSDDSVVELHGTTTGTAPLRADCACGAYGQKTAALEILELGGPAAPAGADLAIGNGAISLLYAAPNWGSGTACVSCDAARTIPDLSPTATLLGIGRFSSPTTQDLLLSDPVVGIRILLNGPHDFTSLDQWPPSRRRQSVLTLRGYGYGVESAVGDFNGDGADDLATFNGSMIWILLGDSHSALAPLESGIAACSTTFSKILAGDLDGDGRSDLAMVCQTQEPVPSRTLHWLPSVPQ